MTRRANAGATGTATTLFGRAAHCVWICIAFVAWKGGKPTERTQMPAAPCTFAAGTSCALERIVIMVMVGLGGWVNENVKQRFSIAFYYSSTFVVTHSITRQ